MTHFGQSSAVRGTVKDTAEKKMLANSVVAILRIKDSGFVKFTRSTKDGAFLLTDIKAGNYFVLVTHPNYADYYAPLSIIDSSLKDIGELPMILRSQLLEQVVVSQKLGAIRIKKDTTEYIADSFKVAANATVEDLLKRLPGVQVDKDGKIKTQGEEVQKVLVDGEEFFGDDPTMATQNIRADAVEKVQVFDKKSDQATFSGIDDGEKTKTINLKLKDDKKNGYFGKINIGGGLKDKFSNQAMINAFKGKRKFAVFGVMSNTGRTGLGWGDREAYGGGSNFEMMDEGSGGIMFSMSSADNGFDNAWGGGYYGEGLPTSWSAGVHFSNKLGGEKQKFNFNYRFNKLNTAGSGGTISQYILPDTFYFRNDRTDNFSQQIRNSLSGYYEIQLDSTSSLKLSLNGSAGKTQNFNFAYSESLSEERAFVNQSQRNSKSLGDNQSYNTTLLWKKKFKKRARTLSVNFDQRISNRNADGFLSAFNTLYTAGLPSFKDTIDQKKINNSKSNIINAKISYTEPLGKLWVAEINYGISVNNSQSERLTFGSINGKYEDYVDSLSSNFSFDVLTNSGGVNFRYNKKTINLSFGNNIAQASFKQVDKVLDTSRSYSFINFFPRASFNWNLKPQSRLGIRYNGRTAQPSINMIQPLRDNSDPFNLRIGNPNLKQQFSQNMELYFNDYKVLSERGIYFSIDFTTTNNAFSNSEKIDSAGRRTSQYENVNGNRNYRTYFSYGFKIKKLDLNIGFDLSTNGSNNNNFVNGLKNNNKSRTYSFGTSLYYSKEKKFEFNLGPNINYNTSISSINSSLENNYWSSSINAGVKVYLPWKTEIASNADLNFRQQTALFAQNRNVALWRASLSKKIFKGETGVFKFELNDLLNQNLGFSRDIDTNNITERTYETIRRFWLVSFTWNFSKNGKAPTSMFE